MKQVQNQLKDLENYNDRTSMYVDTANWGPYSHYVNNDEPGVTEEVEFLE